MKDLEYYVPEVYRTSRDYMVLIKLLQLLIRSCEHDARNFINLLDPEKCPETMLPSLASYVGYDYNYKYSISANRLIIKYYPYLIRNRGNEIGVRMAAALSINSTGEYDNIELLSSFSIDYHEADGRILVYIYYPFDRTHIMDLLEVVRPVGVGVTLVPAEPINANNNIDVLDERVEMDIRKYLENGSKFVANNDKDNDTGINDVGFTEVFDNE